MPHFKIYLLFQEVLNTYYIQATIPIAGDIVVIKIEKIKLLKYTI